VLKKLDDAQRELFREIVERIETCDLVVDLPDGSWEVRLNPPPGRGWRVFDAHRERHTTWMRRRAVIPATPRKASSGGWRLV
jgi:hypothetical protein